MKRLIYLTFILLIITACSTQKNTKANRGYHQMCTKYNVGYNANNAYIDGQKNLYKNSKDDFTQLLNMYPISSKDNQSIATSDMDRTIEKCRKAIKKHSITKKPKKDSKKMKDPKYKYFYEQEEFVKGVKKAWILLGKAELHKGDFLGAASTFGYIQKHYPSDNEIVCEARIWQARAYGEMDWIYEAQDVFDKIDENNVTKRLNADYAETKAFLLIKDKERIDAIPYLQLALKRENNRYSSSRFNYILGQLFFEKGDLAKAADYFRSASKQAQNYPMEFNAKLMMLQCDQGNWRKHIKRLHKIAKNYNNKDYKDQVFCIIGNIYLAHGDTTKAIDSYKTAIEESTRGGVEKAAVQITLGDIYYARKQYVEAHPCFQDAAGIINAQHPDYKRVSLLSETLGELSTNYNTIVLQDSLQLLSTLSKEEQLKIVEKIIEQVKKEEEEEARLAKEAEERGFEESTRPAMSLPQLGGSADWYFYNDQLKTAGANQFRQKWGKRILEDNWRRANKISSGSNETLEDEGSTEEGETASKDQEVDEEGNVIPPHHKPNYYLSQIPKTPEDIKASNLLIADALYNLANIYDEKLNDYPMAIERYEEFHRRFGEDKRQLEGRYACYRICGKMDDQENRENYRLRIIKEFPESKYATILSQPDYVERTKKMLEMQDSLYAETYAAYSKGDFNKVITNYEIMKKSYSMSSLMPKFSFLHALTIGKTQPEEPFYEALSQLVEQYPQSDVTAMSKDILALMSQGREAQQGTTHGTILERREEIAKEETIDETVQALEFSNETMGNHMLILVPHDTIDAHINTLLFDLAAFNFTKFMIKEYDIAKRESKDFIYISISALQSYDEAVWYEQMLLSEPSLEGRITLDKVDRIIISAENMDIINKGKTWEEYREWLDSKTKN